MEDAFRPAEALKDLGPEQVALGAAALGVAALGAMAERSQSKGDLEKNGEKWCFFVFLGLDSSLDMLREKQTTVFVYFKSGDMIVTYSDYINAGFQMFFCFCLYFFVPPRRGIYNLY